MKKNFVLKTYYNLGLLFGVKKNSLLNNKNVYDNIFGQKYYSFSSELEHIQKVHYLYNGIVPYFSNEYEEDGVYILFLNKKICEDDFGEHFRPFEYNHFLLLKEYFMIEDLKEFIL